LLHLPHATLQARQDQLTQQNRENPTLNSIGNGAETLSEFLMGDEALKGLALSDRLLKSAKIAKILEGSPLLSRAVQIGVNAIRGGAVGGALGTFKAADTNDLPQSLQKGAVAGVATGAGTAALGALGAIPALYRGLTAAPKIQSTFQTGVRDVLDTVAKDVPPLIWSNTSPRPCVAGCCGCGCGCDTVAGADVLCGCESWSNTSEFCCGLAISTPSLSQTLPDAPGSYLHLRG
jgi:hypothetical protein